MATESELPNPKILIYEVRDKNKEPTGEYGWRLRAANGQIIATDGRQSYKSRGKAEEMARRIINDGEYSKAKLHHLYPKD